MNRPTLAPGLERQPVSGLVPRPVPAQAAARVRRSFRVEPWSLIWIGATLILLFLVVAPMVRLLISSFQSTDTGALDRKSVV